MIHFPGSRLIISSLPAWLVIRTCLAGLDGTLAIEFGQKSRLGGYLNEWGDLVSDLALYTPILLTIFGGAITVFVFVLIIATELVGLTSEWIGAGRRLEGPLGKVDRAIVFGAVATWYAITALTPPWPNFEILAVAILMIITITNRICFARAELARARLAK